jgi:hypothetical protein
MQASPEQYNEVMKLHEMGHIFTRIAEYTGINRCTIRNWVTGAHKPQSIWSVDDWEKWKKTLRTKEHYDKLSLSKLGSKNPLWKGDKASVHAARMRAERLYKSECPEGCEIHHIDGNPHNNDRTNIKFSTRKKHMELDGRMEKLIEENKLRWNRIDSKSNVALESPFLVKKRLPDVKVLSKSKRLNVTFRRLDE